MMPKTLPFPQNHFCFPKFRFHLLGTVYLILHFSSNQSNFFFYILIKGITTIKIGWSEIGSNFQLLSITTNYYQLLSISGGFLGQNLTGNSKKIEER